MINSSDIYKAEILIVDDQHANVLLLEQMLLSAGYVSVSSTMNPREVIDLHRNNHYDLILLDLQMPGMDGFQVMEGLKEIETQAYVPVLVITAQPDQKLRALKAGARDFVSKPFELAEVLIRAYNMIEVRLLQLQTQTLYSELQVANGGLEAFSHSVSHDLRAPLRHIAGFVKLLQKDAGPSLSEKSTSYLKTISRSTKRMEDLIDDLLAFSRVGLLGLQKAEVDLDQLVRETISDFHAETTARAIQWQIDPLSSVRADRALLRMVFVNLLSNAVKFTGARAEAKIEIGSSVNLKGETTVFVRDNGAGFDPKYTEKLFGVFQRLHSRNEFEGTGIGLANVLRIVQKHGGRVWAEGEEGVGATFYFSIPAQPGNGAAV